MGAHAARQVPGRRDCLLFQAVQRCLSRNGPTAGRPPLPRDARGPAASPTSIRVAAFAGMQGVCTPPHSSECGYHRTHYGALPGTEATGLAIFVGTALAIVTSGTPPPATDLPGTPPP